MEHLHGTILLLATYLLVQQNTIGVTVSDCVVDNSDSEVKIFILVQFNHISTDYKSILLLVLLIMFSNHYDFIL